MGLNELRLVDHSQSMMLTQHYVGQAVRDGKDAKALYESGIAGDY